jgi:hypothetical protein
MVATGHKLVRFGIIALLAPAVRADQAQDIRVRISQIATALTAGNPDEAMIPFDKSCPDYAKLSSYFAGLTSAFQVENEVSVTDEEDTPTESKVSIDWSLTLSDLGTNATIQRTAVITAKLVRKSGEWKIVAFAPIQIFNPQQKVALPGGRGSAAVSVLHSSRALPIETPLAGW